MEEVSQHYLQSPTIKEILVFPDPQDEKLVAVVRPDLDHFRHTGETAIYGEVKWEVEFFSQQLEPHLRIGEFVLTNQELPKNELGQIKASEVRAAYQKQLKKRARKRTSALKKRLSPPGKRVVRLLQEKTAAPLISLDDILDRDLGLDSLALVELLATLEETFGIEIQDDEFLGIFTVADLIQFIEEKHPQEVKERVARELTWGQILQNPPPPVLLEQITRDNIRIRKGGLFPLACSLWLRPFCNLVFHLKVYGREGLGTGSYILCSNHGSFLDGFLLSAAAPLSLRARLYFLGYNYYFEGPLVKSLGRWMQVVPVNSSRHLVPAMQAVAHILKQGGVLGIFPEGSRTLTGELRPFKKGVALLAKELGIPLVPVYIHGSFQAWGPNARFPQPRPIQVIFGRAFSADELAARGQVIKPGAQANEATILGLRREVLQLKDELTQRHQDNP